MICKSDVLIFVEDPSPANYIAVLPALLTGKDRRVLVLANGKAKEHLGKRRVDYTVPPENMTAKQILQKIQPKILLVGSAFNRDTLGLKLIAASCDLDIPSVGVIDARMKPENRFRGHSDNALCYVPDWLLVPDEWTKQAFITLGVSKKQIIICGHPQYDFVIEKAVQFAKEDREQFRRRIFPENIQNRSIIVFIDEPVGDALLSSEKLAEYSLAGRGVSRNRPEIIIEEFLDAVVSIKPNPYLAFRLHPKSDENEYSQYKKEFDLISSVGDPLEWVFAADLVVGMTSMLLLEAALMGKPTLSIIPRSIEKEWLPSIGAKATPCVMKRCEIKPKIEALLQEKIWFKKKVKQSFVIPDSTKHVIAFLEQFLEKRKQVDSDKS